jgi:hypothetical protein
MTKEFRTILTPSLALALFEVEAAVKDGWTIDVEKIPAMFGWQYEIQLVKAGTPVSVVKKAGRPTKEQ